MTGRRTSARQAAKATSNPPSSQTDSPPNTGAKRKTEAGTQGKSKRGKKANGKEQSTIESSMPSIENGEGQDVEMKDRAEGKTEKGAPVQEAAGDESGGETAKKVQEKTKKENQESEPSEQQEVQKPQTNGLDEIMKKDDDHSKETPAGTGSKVEAEDDAVEVLSQREEATPSNILEKGIIYFFFRGRVGVDDPSGVNDVARSYVILRPLPVGAKLEEGPIGDSGKNRLLALPKKVLPVSAKDRFMTFVEKANASMDDIKERLSSSDYSTKTVGVRHTPAANPVGEGVYAITQTGRETHLAYIITLPRELENVQREIGLRQRGSYITSAKNPQSSGPANAQLPQGAEYPQAIIDEFGGRGWMPLQPKLLDYNNTQFLLIGHSEDSLQRAVKAQNGEDQQAEKETPLEEIEKLEKEDEQRVQGLNDDHAVFKDLGLSSQEFSKLQTTW